MAPLIRSISATLCLPEAQTSIYYTISCFKGDVEVLEAITVRETKPVDEVLLVALLKRLLKGFEHLVASKVPVFKHPVKKDLLPFEDRISMCNLAVSASHIGVSSVEQETGESNAVMLRALRKKYPKGSRLLWVCGDDVLHGLDRT